jgi:hypothetical protein
MSNKSDLENEIANMIRLIILSFYLIAFFAEPGSKLILCYHPDHGLLIETTHDKASCATAKTEDETDFQKNTASCIDTPLIGYANIPTIVSLSNLLVYFVSSERPLATVPFSTGSECAPCAPYQSVVSRHISSTILRI